MSFTNSSSTKRAGKPDKPAPDFPLFAHATRRWAKKINGKLVYFGPWENPDEALQRYYDFLAGTLPTKKPVGNNGRPDGDTTLFWHSTGRWAKKIRGKLHYFGRGTFQEALDRYTQQKDELHTGRKPSDDPDRLTIYLLCAKFLTTKKAKADAGNLSPRSLLDYAATCKLIIKAFGKNRLASDVGPDDFIELRKRMARTWGPVRIGNEVNRVRIVFRYGHNEGLLKDRIIFGEVFSRPSKKSIRNNKRECGAKMFEAAEIRKMLATAEQPLRSTILLGINCAFGNSDVGTLPLSEVDLESGWLTYERPKTDVDRRIPMWAETIEALRQWLTMRPQPKNMEDAGLVFVTKYGGAWNIGNRSLSNETRKLLDKLGINGHRSFYALRHTFQTVGEECGDFIAVRKIMGHASNDIGDVYRERVSDDRLRKATEHVRTWLLAGRDNAP